MAHSTIRFAAGAGVVAASLLIVGPNPADAVADEDGSSSQERLRPRFGEMTTKPRQQRRCGSRNRRSTVQMNLGTGGSDLEDVALADSFAPDGQVALRSAAVAEAARGRQRIGAPLAAVRVRTTRASP